MTPPPAGPSQRQRSNECLLRLLCTLHLLLLCLLSHHLAHLDMHLRWIDRLSLSWPHPRGLQARASGNRTAMYLETQRSVHDFSPTFIAESWNFGTMHFL
jgi:hypothetical protein